MLRALKVSMFVYAIIGILFGLGFLFLPNGMADMAGFTRPTGSHLLDLAYLGVSWITISVFIVIAARSPLENILWVKAAIMWAALNVAVEAFSLARGFGSLAQIAPGLIIDGTFLALFLVFYPWRPAEGRETAGP
jgi:hypothetical protein